MLCYLDMCLYKYSTRKIIKGIDKQWVAEESQSVDRGLGWQGQDSNVHQTSHCIIQGVDGTERYLVFHVPSIWQYKIKEQREQRCVLPASLAVHNTVCTCIVP